MKMKVKQVIDLLEANGWLYIGTRGDHHKFYMSILREAGLKEQRKQNELNEDNHAHIDSNH